MSPLMMYCPCPLCILVFEGAHLFRCYLSFLICNSVLESISLEYDQSFESTFVSLSIQTQRRIHRKKSHKKNVLRSKKCGKHIFARFFFSVPVK